MRVDDPTTARTALDRLTMAYRWETADGVWLERPDSGTFELAAGAGGAAGIDWAAQARSRLPDVAQLLGASVPAGCAHAPIFPQGFAYCPQCGKALTSYAQPVHRVRAPAWWGASSAPLPVNEYPLPRHVPHGLPVTALPLAASIETRPPEPAVGAAERRMPTPPNALCVFAAADFGYASPRLLALAYTRNVLQYWDPLAAAWHLMASADAAADLSFTASDYAWLPAAPGAPRGEVALLPSAQGLLRLTIDPVNLTFHTRAVLHAAVVSAPGAVGRHIACLYASADGVRLWTALSDGADPEALRCDGDASALPLPAAGWSRPYSYDGRLIWLHAHGQLLWRPGSAPQWHAWPDGWTPRLKFGGPVKSRHGLLWLIGHDGQGYSFVELGRADGQVQRIDGARLGFGTLLFRRGHQVKNEPWDSEDVEDQTKADALVLPLLENVSSTRSQPTGLVLRIEPYTGKAEAALDGAILPRTFIEWIGQRNVILDEVARLSDPAGCVPFVYDGCLWLHHPKWNEIRGWHLKALT